MTATPFPPAEPPAAPAAGSALRQRPGWLFWVALAYFILGAFFLLVREVAVPRIAEYRPQIAAAIERALGLPVAIEALSADWVGLRPRLHIRGLQVSELDGRAAMRFERVDAVLAWSSLLRLRPHFHRLEIFAPQLAIRRDGQGRLYVAGLPVDTQARGGGGSLAWLLAQREIVVREASLSWTDDWRQAPELRLERVDFRLERRAGRHRFGLRAQPPAALAQGLDLRGDLVGVRADEPGAAVGELYLALDQAVLGAWVPWIDYPVEVVGRGGLRAWITLEGARQTSLSARLALDGVLTRLAEGLPELALDSLSGQLSLRRSAGGMNLQTRGLTLRTGDGVALAPVDLDLALRGQPDSPAGQGEFRVNRLEFGALARLAAHLPLDDAVRQRLAAFDPRGLAREVRITWKGALAAPLSWRVRAGFEDIGLAALGALPGLGGLSGDLEGDERSGRFRIAGRNAWIDLPAVFPEPRLALSTLQAEGGWSRREGRLELALDHAAFGNPDATGEASGRYWPSAQGPGEIDLSARLLRADGQAVWRYMPLVVNQETRDWLRTSIVGGTAPEARLRLRGDLSRFPFREGGEEQFLVTARVAGARLDYAPGWPAIEGIDGELRFEAASMRISAERGRIFGVQLRDVVADLPDLEAADGEVMTITGTASGPSADFLRFVSESPVAQRIDRFTDDMRAEGRGNLALKLVMPLRDVATTRVEGRYRFNDNRLWVVEGLPPLESAAGTLDFTADTLSIPQARARLFGETLRLSARTEADGRVHFKTSGRLAPGALRAGQDWPVLAHLSGDTDWQADISLEPEGTRLLWQSSLQGLASSLPAPFNKSATESWPLSVELMAAKGGERQTLQAALAGRAQLMLQRRATPLGWAVERGGLALFGPLRSAPDGIMIDARLDEFDLDAWRRALRAPGGAAGEGEAPVAWPLAGLKLEVGRLQAFGQTVQALELDASALAGDWRGQFASREAAGRFEWRGAGDGALFARLQRLHLTGSEAETAKVDGDEAVAAGTGRDDDALRRLPAIDLQVDDFSLRDKALGALRVQAINRGGQWQMETLTLSNADGHLSSSGVWRGGARPVTRLDFRLETGDAGRLLHRLGYPDAVREGGALLTGKLDWRGSPLKVDYPSLHGALALEVIDGQFNRLEPGVGRLLGVLSLQALPRRITLDFRDVFSEGFVFDRVSGSIAVDAGVMRTDDLQIRGPAARIAMRGSTDLEAETQDLHVTVQPTLSESVAIGAAAGLINPMAGVVTYLAQKVLSDPIEKLLSFEYAVSGTWAEPRVEKIGGPIAAPAATDNTAGTDD